MVLIGWGCLFVFGSGRWSSLHQGGQPSNGIGKVEGKSGGPCRMNGLGMAGGPLALMALGGPLHGLVERMLAGQQWQRQQQ